MAKASTRTKKLPEIRQGSLLAIQASQAPRELRTKERVHFENGDPARLFVGAVPLEKFLQDGGLKWVIRLAKVMEELDWTAFEASYKPGGRPPLHPKRVVGLIMFGLMLKQTSLRQLEGLALRDLGAWWLTGGLTPDYTTITKFIQRHEKLLSNEFFVATTSLIVKRLKLKRGDIAIDGTVVQSAASTAGVMRREALEQALTSARDAGDTAEVTKLEIASKVLANKQTAREEAGRKGEAQVSAEDPEAVLQPKKNSDDYELGVKPLVATHSSGLIIAQTVSPQSETSEVPALLAQHEQIFGGPPTRVMADAGFHTIALLALFVSKDIDALIPSGRGTGVKAGRKGLFAASAFKWNEETQSPWCPSGKSMSGGRAALFDRAGRAYREYDGVGCAECPLRAQCTKGKGRHIKRYEGDELKEAMAMVMAHPAAKRAYRQRSAIVEPTFARLRVHGLSRFTRRGTRGSRLEFALACVAHNLRLLLWSSRGIFVAVAATRLPGAEWRLAVIAIGFHEI